MATHRKRRVSSAHAIALLALFVALSGTSYAVSKLPKNSVGTEQVKDRSLQSADLALGVLQSGPRGPRGAQGPAGSAGAAGAPGPSNVSLATAESVKLSRDARSPVTVLSIKNLPAGSYLVQFAGEATLRVQGAGMYVGCETRVNGETISAMLGIIGDVYGGNESLSDLTATRQANPFNLTVACYVDQNTAQLPGLGPLIDRPKLVATQVGSVNVVPQ